MPFLVFRIYPMAAWLIAGVFTVIAVFVGWRAIDGARVQLAAEHYPTANGQVIRSDIVSRSVKGGRRYRLEIVYEFTVAGRRHVGTRRQYEDKEVSTSAASQTLHAQYPVGHTMRVYYNPDDPGDCILVPGIGVPQYVSGLTALATVLLAGCFWGTVIRLARPEFDPTHITETDTGFEVRLRGRSHLELFALTAPPLLWIGSLILSGLSAGVPNAEAAGIALTGSVAVAALVTALLATSPTLSVDFSAKELTLPEGSFADAKRVPFADLRVIAVRPRDIKDKRGRTSYTVYDCVVTWVTEQVRINEATITTFASPVAAELLVMWLKEVPQPKE